MGALVSRYWIHVVRFMGWQQRSTPQREVVVGDDGSSADDGAAGDSCVSHPAKTADNHSLLSNKHEHPKPSLDAVPPNKKSKINEENSKPEEIHFESIPNVHFGSEECPESLLPVFDDRDESCQETANELFATCGSNDEAVQQGNLDLDIVEEGHEIKQVEETVAADQSSEEMDVVGESLEIDRGLIVQEVDDAEALYKLLATLGDNDKTVEEHRNLNLDIVEEGHKIKQVEETVAADPSSEEMDVVGESLEIDRDQIVQEIEDEESSEVLAACGGDNDGTVKGHENLDHDIAEDEGHGMKQVEKTVVADRALEEMDVVGESLKKDRRQVVEETEGGESSDESLAACSGDNDETVEEEVHEMKHVQETVAVNRTSEEMNVVEKSPAIGGGQVFEEREDGKSSEVEEEQENLSDDGFENSCSYVKNEADNLSVDQKIESGGILSHLEATGVAVAHGTPEVEYECTKDNAHVGLDESVSDNCTFSVEVAEGKNVEVVSCTVDLAQSDAEQITSFKNLGSIIGENFALDHGDPPTKLTDSSSGACAEEIVGKIADVENIDYFSSDILPDLQIIEDKDTENVDPNIGVKNAAKKPKSKIVNIQWTGKAECVLVTGSWLNWSTHFPLQKLDENLWSAEIEFEDDQKEIELKFIVDGVWLMSPKIPTVSDGKGNVNNVIKLV